MDLESQGGFRTRIYDENANNQVTYDIFEVGPNSYFGAGIAIELLNSKPVFKLAVMGLDGLGNKTWMKKYGSINLMYPNPAFIFRTFCRKGNSFYYGGCLLDSLGNYLATIAKFSQTGDLLWQKYYTDSSGKLVAQGICVAEDGGFLLTGYLVEKPSNEIPCFIIKTDSAGKELWRKKLNKSVPNYSDGKAIIQHSASKKIVIAGYQKLGTASSFTQHDNILVLDSAGTIVTQITYGSVQWHDMIETSDGNIVVVGLNENSAGLDQAHAAKFAISSPDVPIWEIKDPIFTYENSYNSVIELSGGNLLIAGSLDSLRSKDQRYNNKSQFLTVTAQGQIIRKRLYDYATNTIDDNAVRLTCLNPTSDSGWITSIRCGYNKTNPFIFVKYDSMGCDSTQLYCESYKVGISDYSNSHGITFFPNPASGSIKVGNLESYHKIEAVFYDHLGRKVMTTKISQHTIVDISQLKPGFYYINLLDGDVLVSTKKLVIDR